MKITTLSWLPDKPCTIVQWPNVTLLLDCAADFTPFCSFLPHIYQSQRMKKLDSSAAFELPYLKVLGNNIYVDGTPEVHTISVDALQMDKVDCILASNWDSLLALPFYTEGTGFCGVVYATDPVFQLGRLLMEEMIELFHRIPDSESDDRWKNEDVCATFDNAPFRNPAEWHRFYGTKDMEAALARVTTVSFNQEVKVLKIAITAVKSGHSIGSCNWKVVSEMESLGYIGTSSVLSSHTGTMEYEKLKNCDNLLLTSLSLYADTPPEQSLMTMIQATTETLKRGGNVLLPMSSIGVIFDMVTQVSKIIDSTVRISSDTPIYFISPVAKKALALSNVNAEWLCEARQNLVYQVEEPFSHSNLIKNNRLRVFESLFGNFSKEFKTPCVMFTSHTSLRIGDAPYMLELWANDSKNTVIITDPEFSLEYMYGPFKDQNIRCVHCPIDTRLDFPTINGTILPLLKPKLLLVPMNYTAPMFPNRPDLMIQFGGESCVQPLRYGETATIAPTRPRKRKIAVHPEVASQMVIHGTSTTPEFGYCQLAVNLSAFDDAFELVPAIRKNSMMTRPKFIGTMTAEKLMDAFKKRKINALGESVSEDSKFCKVRIEEMDAVITVSEDGNRTNIQAPQEHRALLLDVITSALQPLGTH